MATTLSFTEKELKGMGKVLAEYITNLLDLKEKQIILLRKLILKLEDRIINENYEDLLILIKTIKEVININE